MTITTHNYTMLTKLSILMLSDSVNIISTITHDCVSVRTLGILLTSKKYKHHNNSRSDNVTKKEKPLDYLMAQFVSFCVGCLQFQ